MEIAGINELDSEIAKMTLDQLNCEVTLASLRSIKEKRVYVDLTLNQLSVE
jgi:hypothetical protein